MTVALIRSTRAIDFMAPPPNAECRRQNAEGSSRSFCLLHSAFCILVEYEPQPVVRKPDSVRQSFFHFGVQHFVGEMNEPRLFRADLLRDVRSEEYTSEL